MDIRRTGIRNRIRENHSRCGLKKFKSGNGFLLIEMAIALPLLTFLLYALTLVNLEIFRLGRNQLADYILMTEAQHVLEIITHEARAAKEISVNNEASRIKIVYHVVNDENAGIADIWDTQYIIPREENGIYRALNRKRQATGFLGNPITGGNYFGDTKINFLKFTELNKNVLHITLEMESLVTGRKIKLNTAVYMSSCEKKVGLPRE